MADLPLFPGEHIRPDFDGKTYERGRDRARLTAQLDAVRMFMRDQDWHTLEQISKATGAPQASVSARLRDLRKPKFGRHTIERSHVTRGLFRYRML